MKLTLILLLVACSLIAHSQPPFVEFVGKGKPSSQLKPAFCNQNINSWTQIIEANVVPGANMYRFKITDAVTGLYEIIETPVPQFTLSQLTMALVPQHALTVSVAYRVGVKWFPYGPTCLIKPKFVETWCGFDPILDNLLEVPGNQEILDQQLNEIIEKTNQSQTKSTYIYTIPVVFHIVDNGPITTADFVTNTDIYDQLALLNTAFENLLFSTNSAAADIEVRFCLAKQIVDDAGVVIGDETDWGPYWTGYTGGESVTYGITRTSSAISDAHEIDTDIANPNGMVGLANLISFPYERYLNIWIVNSITDDTGTGSILGYSPYPIMSILSTLTPEEQGLLDGVVVRSDGFINGTHPTMNSGKVLVHEVGHYLKLYHVWTDACHSPTDCATMGDFICDTPPQYEPDWNGCNTLSNTCDPAIDPHDNHMSYAQESCKNTFTLDQKNRMHAIIGLYRSNLVSTENLSLTAPDCIDPLLLTDIISTTSDNICTGGSVSFMSTPTPAPGTFVWNFPGGIPATSTSGSPTVTYTSPGIYDVSITITSGLTNTVINEIQSVYVSDCNPVSSNLGNWFYGQQVGLNFASGIAQNTTYFVVPPVNNISTPESATSYSDDAGNLVLYSDGNTIYNQLHAVMAGHSYGDVDGNDYVPLSSGSSAHRGVVAFEDPNNVNTPGEVGYYVFHTSSAENMPANGSNNHGLGYSHVLVNSINPLGIVDEINIRPLENYSISECVAAVSHCNGRDFWVMVQGSQYNLSSNPMTENPGPLYSDQQNYFFAYLVDPSGLNGTPTASIKAPTAKSNTDFFTTYKFSPDGNIFSVLTTHSDNTFDIFFYQFDRSNGSLSFLTSFDIPDNNSSYYNHRDLEYSPDGNVLYVLTTAGLYQVDISSVLLAPTSFNYTFTDLDQIQHYALELAPDQRIYITSQISSTKLSVINFPNNMNTSSWSNECGLNINSFHYDYSRFNNLSFQNQVRQIDNTAGGFEYTQQNCFEFDFIPNQCGTSYFWDFGGLGTSTDYTPTFTFPSEGNYIVELTVDGNTSIETISITEPNASIVGNPVIACGNEFPVDFFASPNGDYLFDWSFTGGLPNSGNLNFISVILEDPFGDLTLTITDPATGCTSTTTTHIISGCCPGTVQIDHPFKMNSTTPGRSEGFDVALDLTQDLVYYAGNFNADMSLGTYNLTASTPKENFIAQLYEDNCLGWLKQYPIFVSTQTLSPIETYVFKTRPINVQTTSSGQVFMANQVYGHSYIASVDPVTGNQTILFNLFNDAIPGSGSNIITDFVIDEANSRIVFIATINSSLLDFAPAFVGAPVSRVFVGSISYIGTPLSYNFLTTD
ncbi:MAG: PKD domain-containing protein, partial [Crocinitomicaceae bacterium]|nr:PKD domain-containing protein [Crocinitomicaceae bacterium]